MNLQVPVDNTGGRAILSLDAAKAFDSVEWPYLLEILARFGLGSQFIAWVKVLYSGPRARLRINNNLSSFDLPRGTQQGCPLSPLLFALAVEPLAILIRNAPEFARLGVLLKVNWLLSKKKKLALVYECELGTLDCGLLKGRD